MTQKEFFNAIIEANINDDVTAVAKGFLERLEARKEKRSTKPTKTQLENIALMNKITEYASEYPEGVFASDIAANFEISIQKASALCHQLAKHGQMMDEEVKVKNKGKLKKYTVVTTEAEEDEDSEE